MSEIDPCDSYGKEKVDISDSEGVPKGTEPPCSSGESNRDSLNSDEFEKLEFDQIPQMAYVDGKPPIETDFTNDEILETDNFPDVNISQDNYDSYIRNEANLLEDLSEETSDKIIIEESGHLPIVDEKLEREIIDHIEDISPDRIEDVNIRSCGTPDSGEGMDYSIDSDRIVTEKAFTDSPNYGTEPQLVSQEIVAEESSYIEDSQQTIPSEITKQPFSLPSPLETLTRVQAEDLIEQSLPINDTKSDTFIPEQIEVENHYSELEANILDLSPCPVEPSIEMPSDIPSDPTEMEPILESSPVEIISPESDADSTSSESSDDSLAEEQPPLDQNLHLLESGEPAPITVIDTCKETHAAVVEKVTISVKFSETLVNSQESTHIETVIIDDLESPKMKTITHQKYDSENVIKWSSFSPLMNLIYWRDVKKSGVVFAILMVILLSLVYVSFISVVAYSSLALLAGTISFTLYKNVMNAVQKSQGGHPFKEYLDFDTTVSSDKAHELTDLTISQLNASVSLIKRLFLVEDLLDSVKFGCLLWCLTCLGSWFNGLTLVIYSVVSIFTLPKVYEQNKALIDQYIELVSSQVNTVMAKVRAAIPIGGGNKDKEQ